MSMLLDPKWQTTALAPLMRLFAGKGYATEQQAKTALAAVMAPGEVLRNPGLMIDPETGRTSNYAIGRSADLASQLSFGAPATTGAARMAAGKRVVEPNVLNIFAGPTAKTADKAALKMAQDMAEQGIARDEIWNKTGWFKGVDGKWRFEIDDSASSIRSRAADALNQANVGDTAFKHNADGVLQHDPLHEAYPDLWKIETTLEKGGGYPYKPSARHQIRQSGKEEIIINAANPNQAKQLNLHELQHPVQMKEGYARGGDALNGDISMFRDEIMARALDEHKRGVPLGDAIARAEMEKRLEIYNRMAGEVEARNVETRMNMTPSQRRATPPWATYDIPEDNQIVRFW